MRNFYPLPTSPYNGTFSARPFNGGLRGQTLMVNSLVKWASYNVAGQSLGTANPDFNVTMDLNAAASNTVSLTWVIRSIYIDNMGNNFPVFVNFPSTGFTVSCPANSSGWYQVFTFDRRAWIVALGISDIDIQNLATTDIFFTDAIVNSYLDQEEPTAVVKKLASPTISYGGSGGNVVSVNVVSAGRWASDPTGVTFSGGGGAGAVARLTLDPYGEVTTATVLAAGAGYTSPPNASYTGIFSVPPGWNGNIAYATGDYVSWGGFVYARSNYNPGGVGIPPTGNLYSAIYWQASNIPAVAVAPVFKTSISPIVGGVSFSNVGNFGAAALGDQISSYIDTVSGVPATLHQLFGSPYADGFIYITNIDVTALNLSTSGFAQLQITDDQGNSIFVFLVTPQSGKLLNLQGMNIKLPANKTYSLFYSLGAQTFTISTNIVWTYSKQ